jgi:hypothetical protein
MQFSYNSHIEAHIYNYIAYIYIYIYIYICHHHVHALYYAYIKFTYSHKLNIYNIYSKSYTKSHWKLASRREGAFGALALLCLLVGLLLPPVLLLLSFSTDIMCQCDIVCLGMLKFFLDRHQFVF